jgi:hypothetical protein
MAKHMHTYIVRLAETDYFDVRVEAENEEGASKKALEMRRNADISKPDFRGNTEIDNAERSVDSYRHH